MTAPPDIRISFRAPSFDPDELARWFRDALQLDPPRLPASVPANSPAAYLAHGLRLAMQLLRAGKVAVLRPPSILACRPHPSRPGYAQASLVIPLPGRLPADTPLPALRCALEACEAMASQRLAEDARAKVFSILEDGIAVLDRRVPGGRSTVHVLEAAVQQGIPVLHLAGGLYQLGWGSKGLRVDRSSIARDAAGGARLAQNKAWTAHCLRAAGLPAPVHGVAQDSASAQRIAARLGWPVVVKPVDADRGEGVTVGVRTQAALATAFELAQSYAASRQVVIERQVSTICHRLFVTSGGLLYALRRSPRAVTGDGKLTVSALIAEANRREAAMPPWKRSSPFPEDDLARRSLAEAGFTFDSVPSAGQRTPLRPIQSTAWGGTFDDVTARVHPDNAALAREAARLFDLEVAGIDLLTDDISVPWHESGAVINEVNYAPSLGVVDLTLAYLPEYLSRVLGSDGRIPVEAFVGGDALRQKAEARQQALVAGGSRCFLVEASRTLRPDGRPHHTCASSLATRVEALLTNCDVDALIVVAESEPALRELPIDRFSARTLA